MVSRDHHSITCQSRSAPAEYVREDRSREAEQSLGELTANWLTLPGGTEVSVWRLEVRGVAMGGKGCGDGR